MMNNTTKVIGTLVISGMLAACGGNTTTEGDSNSGTTQSEQVQEIEVTTEFVLPSTVQIGELFRNSGLKYAPGITLDPQKAENFNSTYSKYFGFGVYWVDMTYCILNNQTQEARKYMDVVKSLGDEMGAGELYNDEVLLERFDRNLDNQDSILDVLIDIDERTDIYVEDNAMHDMALVYFVGGWIEGMYIGFQTESLDSQTEVTGKLMEQMVILENLVKGLSALKGNDAKLDQVIVKLNELYDYYMAIPEIAHVDGPISEVEIPLAHLKVMGDQIVELRTLITE